MAEVPTSNAIMVTGFVMAGMPNDGEALYQVKDVFPSLAYFTLEHRENGNLYRVSVEQIGGTE